LFFTSASLNTGSSFAEITEKKKKKDDDLTRSMIYAFDATFSFDGHALDAICEKLRRQMADLT